MKQNSIPKPRHLITEPVFFNRTHVFTGTIEDIRNSLDKLELEIINGRISYVVWKLQEAGGNVRNLKVKVFGKRLDDIIIDQKHGNLTVVFRKEDHPEELEDLYDGIDMAEAVCYELEKKLVSPGARLCKNNPFPDDTPPAYSSEEAELAKVADDITGFIQNAAMEGPFQLITAILSCATGLIHHFDTNGELHNLAEEMLNKWDELENEEFRPQISIPLNKKAS